MEKVKLGIVCLARTTYDYKAAANLYVSILSEIKKIRGVEWEIVPDLVISVEDGAAAAAKLASAVVDGIVCISGTFHLGHLVLQLRNAVKVPFLLWGLPELPYNGGKIRLNSVCGVNLNASNLYKSGIRDYTVTIGKSIDTDWIDAIRVIKALSKAKIGIAGFRADGFFNVGVQDNEVYGAMGALVDHYELSEIYDWPVIDGDITEYRKKLTDTFVSDSVTAEQVDKVATLCAKLKKFYEHYKLDALAIRCWPEFAHNYGISPCASMSLLQSEGLILACEGDIDGALSMLAHKAMGAETPFLFDFSQVDFEKDFALFWHCGVAPANLWDGRSIRSLDTYFAGGKGVTADFVLRDGSLSVLRLDSVGGAYRVFLEKAKTVPMEKLLKGTYMKAVFDKPVKDVLSVILDNGIAHHSSVVYGSYVRPMKIVAKIKGWKVFE